MTKKEILDEHKRATKEAMELAAGLVDDAPNFTSMLQLVEIVESFLGENKQALRIASLAEFLMEGEKTGKVTDKFLRDCRTKLEKGVNEKEGTFSLEDILNEWRQEE